ncbi:MAG: hypothetical protein FJX42_04985 [Alphaproteobacteria bacterium]|nr:hypothetical protein [Alphaproteobacteria bacterium]
METALGILLVASLYLLVYYRLLVRWFLDQDSGVKETVFAALFTPPPWGRLSPLGRKYAKRYFAVLATIAVLFGIAALTVKMPDFG